MVLNVANNYVAWQDKDFSEKSNSPSEGTTLSQWHFNIDHYPANFFGPVNGVL